MSKQCFICGEDNPNVLQRHHLVPRRFDGDDNDENTYRLCANCHQAVEKMYNNDFYDELGIEERRNADPAPETIPAGFVHNYIKRATDNWVAKEKVREVYKLYTAMRGIRRLPSAPFGRAFLGLEEYDIQATRHRDGEGGFTRAYSGIELTGKAETLLRNRQKRPQS